MIRNINKRIESERGSDKIIWKPVVASKDSAWKIGCFLSILKINILSCILKTKLFFIKSAHINKANKVLNKISSSSLLITNQSDFRKLLLFYKHMSAIIDHYHIKPVLFGSLAYIFYTNKKCAVHDFDFIIFKSDSKKLIKNLLYKNNFEVKKTNIGFDVYSEQKKISFTYYQYRDFDSKNVTINIDGVNFQIISREKLIAHYTQGYIQDVFLFNNPKKAAVYADKIQNLIKADNIPRHFFLRFPS
ncbi:hypothetical protein ISS04_04375 [Candidatus Woesearchaeota archaeon]|nr:hypothetical protein [Candidatus Woesearchaeota archaeon]